MGTSISISFLSANSLQNCEAPEIHPTHRSRTKEQLIADAESEARVKLEKLRLRIRELESQKKVLVLCMKQIQNRLNVRISRINKEHDELGQAQASLLHDDSNVTKVAAEEPGETFQCVTETTMAENRLGQMKQQETHAMTETVGCVTETTMAENRVGQTQQQEAHAMTETVQCVTETIMAENRVGQIQQQEAHAETETVQCVSETTMIEDRAGQTQQQEVHVVKETVQCVIETTMIEDKAGQTQQQETHVVTPDTATIEPYMNEQEESLLNQLLHKKLNYKQNCVVGIDVNTGVPVTQSNPHVYMTALEKSLLNKLGTMCLCDLWHKKGLKLKDCYIGHSKINTQHTDDTLQGNAEQGQENVTQVDKSTNQLPEPQRLDSTQITNESTYKPTDDCTCPCNSLDSCSPQVLSTQAVTYCISDMLASCSQPVTETVQVANKSPTSHHFTKRREQRRSLQTKKSAKQQMKSKSNLSSQSRNTAQEEVQKRPYACSYDSSFWKKLQFQPIADNVGKENETAQNQTDSVALWRNASIGDNKNKRKEPEVQIQSNNSTAPMPFLPVKVVTDNNLKTISAHTQLNSAKQQSKYGGSDLNTDEALKSAIDAIRRCPQVTLSVYRLEHLTNTLESQIVYLEALSSFNMYLKAPLIMREVCAKLDPYFLWDWCQYANKTRARDSNCIHRDMLNFLKKKVYCSTLYLRPYYEESTSCNKEVLSS